MKIIKFGGSCLRNSDDIKNLPLIYSNFENGENPVIVVSAMQGITDKLQACGYQACENKNGYINRIKEIEIIHLTLVLKLFSNERRKIVKQKIQQMINDIDDICKGISLVNEFTNKTKDTLVQYGELLSSCLISEYFKDQFQNIEYVDARTIIITDQNYGKATPLITQSFNNIRKYISDQTKIYIVPGFIASDENNNVTTLGREGSDFTAALIATALRADLLVKWTNVDGIMTADPSLVRNANLIKHLSYNEALELAHFGAKVIYPPTLQTVIDNNIPILIKNIFKPSGSGTKIISAVNDERPAVIGLSNISDISLITVSGSGMIGNIGIAGRLFSILAEDKVNVVFITQGSSEHSITIGIKEIDAEKAELAIKREFILEIETGRILEPEIERNQSIIAVVGDKMKMSKGLAGQAFSSLGKNGINIRSIAQGSSERNISMVVHKKDLKKAMNVLHERFFLSGTKKLHLFLIGTGNVGSELLKQISEQKKVLKEKHSLNIKLTGIGNSRKKLFDINGVSFKNWENELTKKGEKMILQQFYEQVVTLNLRNSIFIDETASESVIPFYQKFLDSSINIVTSNKTAASSDFRRYRKLINTARSKNIKFLYETNVGAGLPLIRTIHDMIDSGDRITGFQAVLSGSLNYILNTFKENLSFSKVVRKARELGLTEPDPRVDLSGTDVKRKLLILVRECGYNLELKDISTSKFIPENCFSAESTEAFLYKLAKEDNYFEQIRKEAENHDKRLRYIAEFKNGKASVGLQSVDSKHPLFELDGKDNIIMLQTERYKEQPMVIKGAGAGAEVTASGVFADIMRIAIG